ncbi:MAG TPA: hypothetical protein VNY56_03435 [Methylomirabilota bacterium]|jgi:hypothetical protein|nr:hypothetical protein [Methylomirabilota bacterium]
MKKKKKKPEPPDATTSAELLDLFKGKHTKDTEGKVSWNIPRPNHDDRDPYGRIESQMLDVKTRLHELHPKEPGLYAHELHQKYKREHPEFADEYERELQQLDKLQRRGLHK